MAQNRKIQLTADSREYPRVEKIRTSTSDQGADPFSHDNTFQVMRSKQFENDDRHLVVHAKGERGRIHYLELLLQGFEVTDLGITFGLWICFRIRVINAIHLGCLENDFSANFVGTQGGGGIC